MLIGHERNKAMFEKMHTGGNVPHAFLLTGPAGVGKKDFALWCAKALLGADSRNHPDVFALNAPGIDEVRSLNQTVGKSSFAGGARIVLIENARALHAQASNALLKTIEEPKSATIFFLLCENKEQIVATIRSRCVNMYFGFVPLATIQKSLDVSSIQDMRELWQGRPRIAQELLQESETARKTMEDARLFLKRDIEARFSLIETYTQDKQQFETFVSTLITLYRSNKQWDALRKLLDVFHATQQTNARIAWIMRNFAIQEHTL